MVNQQSIKQVLVVFTLEIVQTAVRRVADQRTIVGDQFTLVGMASEHLGYRPGIAGVDQRPAHTQAKRGADRKSVVEGKSVSVRVDLGGRRHIKTKTIVQLKYDKLIIVISMNNSNNKQEVPPQNITNSSVRIYLK